MRRILLTFVFLFFFSVPVFAEELLPEPTPTPDWEQQIDNAVSGSMNTFRQKTGIKDLELILEKINNLKGKNYKELAPLVQVNLHDLSGYFEDRVVTVADFRQLENYHYMGFSVIDYFRFLIAGFLYFETGLYVWHSLHKGDDLHAD